MNSLDSAVRRQANPRWSELLAGADSALRRAARRAQRRARETADGTSGLTEGAQSEVAHATMKCLPHDPVQFDLLDLLDAVGRTHGISIDSVDGKGRILDLVSMAALQESPATRLHGRRVEAMFGYVAAAIGRCSLVKKEDSRPAFAGNPNLRIPDYRVVTDNGQQFLVEVKNCHSSRREPRVAFTTDYLSRLQGYAALVRTELRLAIYWSRLRMWTMVSPADLRLYGSAWRITLREAIMQNTMAVLGDMHVGTTPPLVCRLLENPDRPPKIDANGRVNFTIRRVEIECAGQLVTERSEKNLAFQLMLFGEWPASERLSVDDDRLLGVEYVAEPSARTPGQGFELIGTLSRMASRRYDELTAPSGRIERLAPNVLEPGTLTPAIPAGYVGQQLPLWILIQQASGQERE